MPGETTEDDWVLDGSLRTLDASRVTNSPRRRSSTWQTNAAPVSIIGTLSTQRSNGGSGLQSARTTDGRQEDAFHLRRESVAQPYDREAAERPWHGVDREYREPTPREYREQAPQYTYDREPIQQQPPPQYFYDREPVQRPPQDVPRVFIEPVAQYGEVSYDREPRLAETAGYTRPSYEAPYVPQEPVMQLTREPAYDTEYAPRDAPYVYREPLSGYARPPSYEAPRVHREPLSEVPYYADDRDAYYRERREATSRYASPLAPAVQPLPTTARGYGEPQRRALTPRGRYVPPASGSLQLPPGGRSPLQAERRAVSPGGVPLTAEAFAAPRFAASPPPTGRRLTAAPASPAVEHLTRPLVQQASPTFQYRQRPPTPVHSPAPRVQDYWQPTIVLPERLIVQATPPPTAVGSVCMPPPPLPPVLQPAVRTSSPPRPLQTVQLVETAQSIQPAAYRAPQPSVQVVATAQPIQQQLPPRLPQQLPQQLQQQLQQVSQQLQQVSQQLLQQPSRQVQQLPQPLPQQLPQQLPEQLPQQLPQQLLPQQPQTQKLPLQLQQQLLQPPPTAFELPRSNGYIVNGGSLDVPASGNVGVHAAHAEEEEGEEIVEIVEREVEKPIYTETIVERPVFVDHFVERIVAPRVQQQVASLPASRQVSRQASPAASRPRSAAPQEIWYDEAPSQALLASLPHSVNSMIGAGHYTPPAPPSNNGFNVHNWVSSLNYGAVNLHNDPMQNVPSHSIAAPAPQHVQTAQLLPPTAVTSVVPSVSLAATSPQHSYVQQPVQAPATASGIWAAAAAPAASWASFDQNSHMARLNAQLYSQLKDVPAAPVVPGYASPSRGPGVAVPATQPAFTQSGGWSSSAAMPTSPVGVVVHPPPPMHSGHSGAGSIQTVQVPALGMFNPGLTYR
eukprot:TRINITY_DN12987_c0_g1_i1.p1 TRINITY_DN12987_c0_g1~~TRINITY_DN12987_c0_g1_i1.p1  ORF type:complete len:903 (+),score=121.16 TRINITY_DN12987_c0_g1_i1:131-2839(+)